MENLNITNTGPILLVDDEKFFRDLMSAILKEDGHEVDLADSAADALKSFRKEEHRVVVLDLVLPDMMGTEVLVKLREIEPDLAVIMVTAYASMESAIEAVKAGAYDYIKKPIVPEELKNSVQRALERQQLATRNKQLVAQLETRIEKLEILSREKEEVFRILDEGLVIVDRNGTITDLNDKASDILDGGEKELEGSSVFDADVPIAKNFLETVSYRAGQPVREMVEMPRGNNRYRHIELVGLPVTSRTGPPRYLLGLRDLTEIKELEKRRQEFLAIVTHDLRTPLTSLKGFVELLLGEDHSSETVVRNYLKIMDGEADRMIALINDLLDLDSLDSERMKVQFRRSSIRDLVSYAVKSMEGMAGRKSVVMDFRFRDDEHDLEVDVDGRRLLQVLINLYSNAIRFSPSGGLVETIISSSGDGVVIEILDDGPGVPPEEQERIFEKYHQVDHPSPERAKGSGLGLAIVKKIIELHGGRISVNNREDKSGSRFVMVLPWPGEGVK